MMTMTGLCTAAGQQGYGNPPSPQRPYGRAAILCGCVSGDVHGVQLHVLHPASVGCLVRITRYNLRRWEYAGE